MRIARDDIPVRINAPGAVARQQTDFGDAAGYGKIGGEYFSPGKGADIAPLLKGLRALEGAQVIEHLREKMGA